MPWLERQQPRCHAPPRRPRAYLASTDEKPGLAPSRALLAFEMPVMCADMRRTAADLRGFVCMERLRRGAEGGAEGPGAASETGHTQNEAIDLPARFTLPHNQGRKVDGPSFDVYPQSTTVVGLRRAG